MTSPLTSPAPAPVHGASEHDRFLARLTRTLKELDAGHRGALIHLEVARMRDLHECYGDEGCRSLNAQIEAVLPIRRTPSRGDPLLVDGSGGFTLLLPGCALDDAVDIGRRLRRSVDASLFSWHGHGIRLGARVGVVELGPQPAVSCQRWLMRAASACEAADEIGGSGVTAVRHDDHAWRDLQRHREWHEHLREIIA